MSNVALLVNPPHAGSYRSAIMRGDSLALATVGQRLAQLGWRAEMLDCLLHRWSVEEAVAHAPERFDIVCVTLMHESACDGPKALLARLRARCPRAPALPG